MLQEFTQEVKSTISEVLQGVHTSIPGKIVTYNPDKCEAEILPHGKFKKPNGEYLPFPQLNHVPILFPQSYGQDFAMVYPINPGDECLILVQEQTLDIWRGSGAESDNDLRFDLTNAVAIMGMFAKPQQLAAEAQKENKLIIQKNGHRLSIGSEGVDIKGNTNVNGSLSVSGDISSEGINSKGNMNINGTLSVGGDVSVSGNITAQSNIDIVGTFILAGVNMNTHRHSGVIAGSDDTGQPK